MNKRVRIHHGYPFMVSLSAMHFLTTCVALRILLLFKFYVYKNIPLKIVLAKALLDCAATVFMNLNLSYNSVSTYQISKLCLVPVTVVMQYGLRGERISSAVAQVLTVLCFAIGFATITDVNITSRGLFWAVMAVLATVYSQMLTTTYLRNVGCDAMQLLLLTSPWISFYTFLMVPYFDDVSDIKEPFVRAMSPHVWSDIAISCALAVAVNVTNYQVLGLTSPLTYQVPACCVSRHAPASHQGCGVRSVRPYGAFGGRRV